MILLLGSITKTLKAKKILQQNGIASSPVQTTAGTKKPDCNNGLKIDRRDIDKSLSLLDMAQIKVKGVYNE